MWRLPLWEDYDPWLDSPVADFNNVTTKPAGGVTAALFLRRFVADGIAWAHVDLYAWNDLPVLGVRKAEKPKPSGPFIRR